MKVFVFILFFASFSFGQEIEFKPIIINQCNKEYVDISSYDVADKDRWYSPKKGRFILPKRGKYYFLFLQDFDDNQVEFSIDKKGVVRDTFYTPNMRLYIYISTPYSYDYMHCGKKAEGKIVDYFYNGNIRLKGTFKNGQKIDTLTKYYRDGNISEIQYKKTYIKYHRNRKLKSYYNFKKGLVKKYSNKGVLLMDEKWRRSKIDSFYNDGSILSKQSKKRKRKFSKEGVLLQDIKRKKVFTFESLFSRYRRNNPIYKYEWSFYNQENNSTVKLRFKTSNIFQGNFPTNINQLKWYFLNKEEVLCFKYGYPTKKISFNYLYENNKYQKYMIFKKYVNGKWDEYKREPIEKLHEELSNLF